MQSPTISLLLQAASATPSDAVTGEDNRSTRTQRDLPGMKLVCVATALVLMAPTILFQRLAHRTPYQLKVRIQKRKPLRTAAPTADTAAGSRGAILSLHRCRMSYTLKATLLRQCGPQRRLQRPREDGE